MKKHRVQHTFFCPSLFSLLYISTMLLLAWAFLDSFFLLTCLKYQVYVQLLQIGAQN